ncbi:alpha-2A adrenergic receptor-like [Piliocolobus tephrosceles]|uniref:alpha-2A adrenergic receptor-like n=1 Tax=Piliocolobus tephrosceles TaxID=591936 RepID=UPI000C2A554A|nr:alpha-2A adrenergic receptor-like [Piliocolobus tephrosceles]
MRPGRGRQGRLLWDPDVLSKFLASVPGSQSSRGPWAVARGPPPRGGAFRPSPLGGLRQAPFLPANATEVPAMGAPPIGCATRRSGRPRPAGPGGTNPARAAAAPPLDSGGFVLGLRPRSRGGRGRASEREAAAGAGAQPRAGPAAAQAAGTAARGGRTRCRAPGMRD